MVFGRTEMPGVSCETRRMRVAVPMEQCWHEVPGGTARATVDLVAELDRRSLVEVVGVAARHRRPPAPPWRPPVAVHQLPLPRLALYEAWHRLRRPRVERATGPVDVVHCMGGAIAAGRAPLVVTVHDLAFVHHPEMFTHHGRRFFDRALALTRAEAAAVIVPSRATLEDCTRVGIDRARLHLVPWGIAVEPVDTAAVDAVRSRFGLHGGYVVVVGTLEPRKNLHRLLEAWARLDRSELTLVVVGPAGWGDAFDASAVPANVTLTGFVDDGTRDALYAGALASVYPSVFEGFGLPVLESMALGCPVVTSSGTATEELITGGAGVAVDPLDPDAIAAGLAELLDDPERQSRIRDAGLARAAAYTWARTADRTMAVYDEVVG